MCLFNFLTNYDSLTCKNEVGLKGNRKTFVIKFIITTFAR